MPGKPSASLKVQGEGPVDAYLANVRLATDGAERLAGTVTVQAALPSGYRMIADLAGDLAPLLAPDQVALFGTDVALQLDARREASGRTVVDRFDVTARSINLGGTAAIAADGLPEAFDITGTLADPDGSPVALPFVADTLVRRAEFRLKTEPGADKGWTGEVAVDGLDRPDLKIARMELTGSGRIERSEVENRLGGSLTGRASGIAPTDPALAQALGSEISGSLRMEFLEGVGGTEPE